jgi:ribulose-5-phosphate 4-epimerase/fuculose-1-phosphate aldolase
MTEDVFTNGNWDVWVKDDGTRYVKWRSKNLIIIKKDGKIIEVLKIDNKELK